MPAAASLHVALLRGINVGGNNLLPMKSLARMFEDAGATDVRTYIQSGNVVFAAGAALAKTIGATISARIAGELGLKVPLVLRSARELGAVPEHNPFPKVDRDLVYVLFLADVPRPAAAAALDPERSPGDDFALVGRDLYLHLRNGAARTKLTNAYFDSKLATISTSRNWRTVLRLIEMTQGAPRA